jgi:hypothetical protein
MPRKIFDGFAYRPFNEDTDGWIDDQPDISDYPAVQNAQNILSMFDEIKELRKEVWRLKKIERMYYTLIHRSSTS